MSWDTREWRMMRQGELLVVEGGGEPKLKKFRWSSRTGKVESRKHAFPLRSLFETLLTL
jgi:hypothetical protein